MINLLNARFTLAGACGELYMLGENKSQPYVSQANFFSTGDVKPLNPHYYGLNHSSLNLSRVT
jgi:hypothetical protein